RRSEERSPWRSTSPSRSSFTLPRLPTAEEAGRPVPALHFEEMEFPVWTVESVAFTQGPPFDYDAWAFSALRTQATHISKDFLHVDLR
ncbi:MAG: hypothetical protein D6795_02930, partial [Deltaproteobacteria bacterium]